MKTKLIWCKIGKCLAEIGIDEQGSPICFVNGHTIGNGCWEDYNKFIFLPDFIRWFYGFYIRIKDRKVNKKLMQNYLRMVK